MMFGFGDDKNPYTESVDLLEDLVIEYISETVSKIVISRSKLTKTLQRQILKRKYYKYTVFFFGWKNVRIFCNAKIVTFFQQKITVYLIM